MTVVETKAFNFGYYEINKYLLIKKIKYFTLHEKTINKMRKKPHHLYRLYVTDHRNFCAIRNESLKHVTINYIDEILNSNEWSKLKPL